MSRLEIILLAVFSISFVFNICVFVYARAAITRLLSVSEELGDLQQMVDSFASHVNSVYELETFYGDQTLKFLLDHAVSFGEQLETFEYIYSLTENQQGKLDNEPDETEKKKEE